MVRRFVPLLTGLTLAVALIGCGENRPPAGPPLAVAHPVHGRIAFSDQTPLKGGIVYFTPTEMNLAGRFHYEAVGLVDSRGKSQSTEERSWGQSCGGFCRQGQSRSGILRSA